MVKLTPVLTEAQIQKQILEWLNLQYKVKAWRNNTGAMTATYKGKKRFMRFSERGAADIFGVYHGRFLAIEVKRPGNKPTIDQHCWLQEMKNLGAIAFWATSLEDCIREFNLLTNTDKKK